MSALLVVCGGKDYGNHKPRSQICIIDQEMRENGKVVRHFFIEIPLIMGEQYAKRIARSLSVKPICHRIARNHRISTWIVRYDRPGKRSVRRICRVLKRDPSVLRVHTECIRLADIERDIEAKTKKRA